MKWHTTIILLICAIPVLAMAEGPTTRPFNGFGPRGEKRMFNPMRDEGPPPTEAELHDAELFLKDNLPNRYKLFSELNADSPMRKGVLRFLVGRYRMLMKFKDHDNEMYDQLLTEAKLEDEVIPLVQAIRNRDPAAESQLREKASQLVQISLDTRKARIERLEQALKVQKEQLADDEGHKAQRIDEKARNLRKQFNGLLDRMENIRRGRPDGPPVGMNDEKVGEISTVSTVP
jgi:hypothetical protein